MTEVPVCDVVCDAVEYLSKLGANLRTRSENLKDKKISKSKLKNTHAVQKAASKLLLICEISKKSLDNVERGMRNVLSIVNKGQAQEESSSDVKSPKGDSKFQYFEFENYKLKISKKVPVKHFISVKVLTKILPRPTLDKYPVYYDCKLFRLRKKQSEHENQESLETCTSTDQNNKLKVTKKIHDSDSDNSTAAASKDDSGQGDKPIIEVETQDSNQSFKNKTTKPQTARRSKIKISDSETEIDTQTTKKDSNVENESEKSDVLPSTSEVECDSIIELDTSANASAAAECIKDSLKKDIDTKKMKKIVRFADESDLSDKEQAQKEVQIEDKKSNKEKQNENASDSDDDVVCISDTDQNNVEEKSASKTKPLIKCVSLSKLLKPNIINSIVDKQIGIKTYVNNKKVCKREDNSSKQKAEEAYWDFKRKEVSAFKSKKFVINIVRLGEFTNEFLVKNNLRKITQLGKVVLEISSPQKNNRILLTPSPPEHVVDTTLTTVESEKIKKSLLNESDSDSDTEICAAKNKNIKRNRRALCISDESDSNKSENISNLENSNAEKNNLCEPSSDESTNATESNKESDKPREKNEKIKKALLDDSDSSNDEVVKKNVAKEKESNTKSALLNSDSDENEETNAKRRKSISVEPPTILESDEQQKGNDKEKFSEPPTILESDEQQKGNDKEKFSEPPTILESDEQQKGNDKEKFSEPPTILESDEQQKGNDKEKFSEPPTILESDEQQNKENDKESFSEPFIGFDSKPGGEIVSKRKRSRDGDTPPPKTMRIESGDDDDDDAKKMLLTYSSEEEDEQLTMSLKKIKDSLLNAGSSEDESSSHNKKKIKESDKKSEQKDKAESSRSSADEDSSNEHQNKRKKLLRKKIGHRKTKQRRDSSSNNSDTQDEKHINGLVNLKTLVRKRRRRRRRQSSSSNSAEANLKDGLSNTMAKAPKICDEDILEADSTSEAGTEDDDGNEEELPNVNLSGLNGDGVDHLAKDDLLDESNSSDGKDKDTEDNKKDTSEDSDTLRSKRRKANAISSDSEAGSSRKNRDLDDDDVKMSDFEEDSEDSSKPKKSKRKREEKKKSDDSDVSSSGSNEGKKKRRRIKQVDDSDLSGSDNENEGRNKHGRKNIRKVMGKNQLEEATKKAAREEKERVARIAERQKLYNNLDFDESGKPDEVVLEKVVLDFDTETKEPLIQVDKGLVKKLKPHQANGIKFMWDACFESVKRIKKDKGSGCILAHCMGLGKTLQVISLTHTLLTHSELTGVQRVLVVCPLSTVLNWVNEFKMWLRNTKNDYEVDIYELSRFKPNSERAFQLQQWFDHGGVCVLGYEMFRNLSADNPKKFKKKMLKSFQQSLVDPGPDLVVCDEGHLLKNEKTSLSQSMNRVRTLRRIVLTGTPLQNNLKEYYCMVQFVKPNLLGKYNEYLNRFVNPITNGQYTDSTEHDIKIMKRRSHVLHKMLDGAVQRRDYGVLAPFLPPKHEYVLFITLTEVQTKLYQHYLDNYSRRPLAGKSSGFLFPDFQSLQRIWTHPLVLKYNSERYEIMQQKKRDREEEDESEGSLADFIDDDSTPDESSTDESSDDMSDASDDSRKKHKKKKASKKKEKGKHSTRRGTRANPVELDDTDVAEIVEVKNENPTEWWMRLVDEPQLDDLRNSHKLVLLFDILRHCEAIGDKLLVFSQSLYSLDLIEHFLGKVDEATQEGRIDEKLGGHVGSWSPGIDYFRLDGQTSCENRSIWCKNFNREDNPRARLFLISTRAGGLGINLVAANRVVIFDVSWNPSHDVQSIFRVYRFGQKKPCYVYRFLAMGTMEEKIYERQVTKQAISKRVIDEQQIDRHYAENDLAELYKFEPEPPSPRPLPPLPKDRLFAELLKEHEKLIYKYHEHDSLLENKEEETLSEEERKAAWEDFENEKNRPPPAPFPNTWNMHNGMMSGLLAQQQQQQVAYAALATLLRKDLPNVSEQQIRDMLPLIYNANPQMFGGYDYGLMQKMSDMYKYATPGMMNAAMMNPAMRTAGGVGSGSSSLAYEPPWQRQQQQQQQMRLQQLLQHQSNMGAKYYAGGLGSRDPVAMALQQQRAREMLTAQGEGSGDAGRRPRGRPPLQVRVPLPAGAPAPPGGASAAPRPAPAADVVNLDSD